MGAGRIGFDVRFRNPLFEQLIDDGALKIQFEMMVAVWRKIFFAKMIGRFFIDLVAVLLNAGANGGKNVLWLAAKALFH